MQTLYTYEGYTGVQENIEKYTLATAPEDPSKPPYVFVGWFYREGETEKPFSFTMPITRDYALYPKYAVPAAVTYLVHYYKKGTTERIADDRTQTVNIGSTVTEKAKMGKDLNLLSADKQGKYYPEKTSTSEIIRQDKAGKFIFYYTEATSGQYTVYYQDADGNNLIDPVAKTTEFSTVTEKYVPIPSYAPTMHSITLDLSSDPEQNKIIFIYEPTRTTLTIQKSGWEAIDENQTFLFHIQGIEAKTEEINLDRHRARQRENDDYGPSGRQIPCDRNDRLVVAVCACWKCAGNHACSGRYDAAVCKSAHEKQLARWGQLSRQPFRGKPVRRGERHNEAS